MKWQKQVKLTPVITIAQAMGMEIGRNSTARPCPCCGAAKRGDEDRRGPIGLRKDGLGWRCHSCSVKGDVVDLVAAHVLGKVGRSLPPRDWEEVRARCAAEGWCEPNRTASAPSSGDGRGRVTRADVRRQIVRRGGTLSRSRGTVDTVHDSDAQSGPQSLRSGGTISWRDDLVETCTEALWSEAGADAMAYAKARGFSERTIRAFELGALVAEDGSRWLVIPLADSGGEWVNVKARRLPGPDGKTARPKYRTCKGRPLPLFGSDRLSNDLGSEPIVVEGELDVLSLFEYGVEINVVSGTSGAGSFDDAWLDMLEPYSGFILALDNDGAGIEGRDALAAKLGKDRCCVAVLPEPDANACLMAAVGVDEIEGALSSARPMLGIEICHVADLAPELEEMIAHPENLIGRPTGSAKLDAALAGIRPGLIVVTGETGEGKTTFLIWLLTQQARQGVPSMLSAFEQSAVGVLQKCLRGEIGRDFTQVPVAARQAGYAGLRGLPLTVIRQRGHISPEDLVDSIKYAVRRLGVRNVLVDHLGFVLPPHDDDRERQAIETVMRELSVLGEHEGVSIFLVVHPSNADVARRGRVGMRHLKGASAIRQDAHEVWVVEKVKTTKRRKWPAAWIHLDKVRSDFASSGKVFLAFDPLSTTYADSWKATPSGQRGLLMDELPGVPKGALRRSKDAASGALTEDD